MPKNNYQDYLDDDCEVNERAIKKSKGNGRKSEEMETDYSIKSKKMPQRKG